MSREASILMHSGAFARKSPCHKNYHQASSVKEEMLPTMENAQL